MRSSTRIDSAVFQLTPTRTRCDLFVTLDGNKVKVASGLVDPFVAHLKTAQSQMSKGGYSIILELEPGNEALWFTKGTIERFVRFVSTPEVLERVHSLELELLQIEETMAMQNNTSVEGPPEKTKPANFTEASRISQTDLSEEKAIILYEPGANPTETFVSAEDEENSKIQLMKVLESRKVMLQKEQGMAFARAVAAEFNIENIGLLLSFAENFGALRLRDACIKFIELWNRKHESGQWVDFDVSEVMDCRSDFLVMNASNIIAQNNVMNLHETPENGKANAESIDRKPTTDQQTAFGHPENYHGKYPHPMFSPWPVHSPGYPMQGIPYYPTYHGHGSYYNPQFPTGEFPRMRRRRNSMDAENNDDDDELWETKTSRVRSQDDGEVDRRRGKKKSVVQESASGSEDDENASLSWKRRSNKRSSRANHDDSVERAVSNKSFKDDGDVDRRRGKKNSVIQESASDSEDDEDASLSWKEKSYKNSSNANYDDSVERTVSTKGDKGAGQWDAFQNFLLQDAEESDERSMVAEEKSERKTEDHLDQNLYSDDFIIYATQKSISDPLASTVVGRKSEDYLDQKKYSDDFSVNATQKSVSDPLVMDIVGRKTEDHIDQKKYSDDFSTNATQKSVSDPLAMDMVGWEMKKASSQTMDENSLFVGRIKSSLDCAKSNQAFAVGMESELKFDDKISAGQSIYEPGAVTLIPKHYMKKETAGYDPSFDIVGEVSSTNDSKNAKTETTEEKPEITNKELKANANSNSSEIKKIARPVIKGRSSKLNSLDESKSQAEKHRKYKADLQVLKKEQEEEKRKRLEALKLERQKRIAARSGSVSSTNASQQKRNSLPAKPSPDKSKSGDLTIESSSPVPRSSVKTLPSMPKRSISTTASPLSKSFSSSPKARADIGATKAEGRPSIPLLRRLSEPKSSEGGPVSSVKVKKVELPVKKDELPVKKDELPVKKDELPVKKGELPVKKDELPVKNDELPVKKNLSKTPDGKKISAILDHDKHKAATLPELKVKTVKVNDGGDYNTIIEKTVVMREPEQPSVPLEHKSVNNGDSVNELQPSCEDKMADAVAVETVEAITTDNIEIEAANLSSEEPCVVPSEGSLTDQNARNDQIPTGSVQIPTTNRAHTNGSQSSKLEKIPEYVEKDKESLKGLRKFLKFGRKNHNSDHVYETDNANRSVSETDDLSANSSEDQVNTLKNLISREEGAPHNQSSRHFSLLSPFRSKNTEKESA